MNIVFMETMFNQVTEEKQKKTASILLASCYLMHKGHCELERQHLSNWEPSNTRLVKPMSKKMRETIAEVVRDVLDVRLGELQAKGVNVKELENNIQAQQGKQLSKNKSTVESKSTAYEKAAGEVNEIKSLDTLHRSTSEPRYNYRTQSRIDESVRRSSNRFQRQLQRRLAPRGVQF